LLLYLTTENVLALSQYFLKNFVEAIVRLPPWLRAW